MPSSPHDDDDVIGRIRRRARAASTRHLWQKWLIQDLGASRAETQEVRAELAAVRSLAASYLRQLGVALDEAPPWQLVDARHRASAVPIPVTVAVDDQSVTIIVTGRRRPADPVRDQRDWQAIRAAIAHVRTSLQRERAAE